MKRSGAIAFVLLSMSGVVLAQRGGGHVGGSAGRGFSAGRSSAAFSTARSAPASHGSFSARPALSQRLSYSSQQRYASTQRSVAAPNGQARRPAFYNPRSNRGYYGNYGLGTSYGLGYVDPGIYNDDDGSQTPDTVAQTPDGGYIDGGYPDGVMPPPPTAGPQRRAAPPAPEAAITLIFKDGRAPLEIHNYALTRTMLYVTDARHRDIPVADLDLAATQKANDDAGVTFTLPTAQ